MPFGMGWLVDVRDLILENPLWMFIIFLLIVKVKLLGEKQARKAEALHRQEHYHDDFNAN